MMWISVCIAVIMGAQASPIKGNNILLGKPTRSTKTRSPASNANDGTIRTYCNLRTTNNPFWEADLLGIYSVFSITVTNIGFKSAKYLEGASIGVSNDKRHVTQCGVFPLKGMRVATITCKGSRNVRYVRVWKDKRTALIIREISAEGVKTECMYDRRPLVQVKHSSVERSARSYIHCGLMCTTRAVCQAFSYSLLEDPNCRLSDHNSTRGSPYWMTGLVSIMEAFPPL